MILVTGGAGFIGSNFVRALNQQGWRDILVVDDLTDGHKFINLADCQIKDYLDKDDFIRSISEKKLKNKIQAIFHLGACATTTEWDGRFMMKNNYEYSKILFDFSCEQSIPFYYASSAAVYGQGQVFKEDVQFESPINVYAYSKFLFDQYVRDKLPQCKQPVVGFRYFNVYGPREQHKGGMASVAYHLYQQYHKDQVVRLFEGCDGYADGEQLRDFIYIDDVVDIMLWFFERDKDQGIFNIGTGQAEPFNHIAKAILDFYANGQLIYVPFPEHLRGAYQSFTQADISALRHLGYTKAFHSVEQGTKKYLDVLSNPCVSN